MNKAIGIVKFVVCNDCANYFEVEYRTHRYGVDEQSKCQLCGIREELNARTSDFRGVSEEGLGPGM